MFRRIINFYKGKAFDLNVFLILRIDQLSLWWLIQLPKPKLKDFYENYEIYLDSPIRILKVFEHYVLQFASSYCMPRLYFDF